MISAFLVTLIVGGQWIGTNTPQSGAAPPGGTAVDACHSAQLDGTFTLVEGSAAMGRAIFALRVTNGSARTCSLPGQPSLQLLARHDRPVATKVTPTSRAGTRASVEVPTNAVAVATVRVAVDVPRPGDVNQAGQPCQPVAVDVRVRLSARSSLLAVVKPPTSFCQLGALSVAPWVIEQNSAAIPKMLAGVIHRLLPFPRGQYVLSARYDPTDAHWVAWLFTPAGPSVDIQGGVGFAHFARGRWRNVAGPGNPGFCQSGVPRSVLLALDPGCIG